MSAPQMAGQLHGRNRLAVLPGLAQTRSPSAAAGNGFGSALATLDEHANGRNIVPLSAINSNQRIPPIWNASNSLRYELLFCYNLPLGHPVCISCDSLKSHACICIRLLRCDNVACFPVAYNCCTTRKSCLLVKYRSKGCKFCLWLVYKAIVNAL